MSLNVKTAGYQADAEPSRSGRVDTRVKPPHVANSAASYVIDPKDGSTRVSAPPAFPPPNADVLHRRPAAPRSSDPPQVSPEPPAPHLQTSPSPPLWARVQREVASWKRGTVSIHNVDPWLQFNVYIRRGFRHRLLRKREAVGSLFLYPHNESFNILTHLAAALLLLSLLLWPPRAALGGEGGGGGADGVQGRYEGGRRGGSPWTSGAEGQWLTAWSASLSDRSDGARASGRGSRGAEVRVPPPQQVPTWLHSLHGLPSSAGSSESASASNAQTGDERGGGAFDAAGRDEYWEGREGYGYVPPGGGASPRDDLRSNGAPPSAPLPSSWSAFFVYVLPISIFASTTTTTASPVAADSPLPLPISVAARLDLSFTPLTWCLLLTFLLSCVYHTFMPCCHSRRGYQQLLQCDIMGVLLSIVGSAYAYFACGMPCASERAMLWAAVVVAVFTLVCLYVAVVAPLWSFWIGVWCWLWAAVQGVIAWSLCAVVELITGAPLLFPPPSASRSVAQPPLQRAQRVSERRRCRGDDARPGPRARVNDRAPSSAAYDALLFWLHRHRQACTLQSCLASPTAAGPTDAGPTDTEAVHVTANQRALVMGVYVLLHLGFYRCLVYPKSQPAFGGFTQGVYYHNLSYLWLFIGGIVNVARFPERVVFHWTRSAARHARRLAAEEAAAWCAEELTRNVGDTAAAAAAASPSATTAHSSASWWRRFCFPKLMATYVVSASTLDYIGNSHNLWHICTVLSAFSNLLAVYYDCMEYDLVVCT
ncbi:hypothetical protein ABB37_01941 [Leptomonas pyrrhocoris]|uniref:Uncharacterized protein n=1 Tax=Leptomonas pyrrhocoris TaxID=157538 RepID=A0A0N0DY33_LEPPY|nr:hypothetical protein ABB37_01941 [Leptomonas pyrrhocoris]KPA83685.1 hypothetical protein ABB37_01941 [Leptomonas pyrrhocoris]|eukprot:XP_015662124.1 hypothetical protein ABB37_01941 [Leptomonas pyrrhocoris]